MEASALPRSPGLPRPRLGVPAPLLRMRSDEQLVALFRAGSGDAFRAIHDRYRPRLLAYARQMLAGSTADAEDALQEVFVRAHAGLLANSSPISLRAWLYRIAHNRCIDQLRRPSPIPSEIMPGAEPALSRGPRHDPPAEAERSEDLRRLVCDVHALPEQQRSALLMRELQGLSYDELALALGISVAAVKSVLLRARGGVIDAAQARAAPCTDIRVELVWAYDRGVRASGRARRHLRECDGCCEYRGELRAVSRQVAGLAPVGPLGHLGMIFGLGGGGGGGLAAGGSTAMLGGAATATATKVAALVCCAALVGGAGALRSQAPHHRSGHFGHSGLAHRAAAPPSAAVHPQLLERFVGGAVAPDPPRSAGSSAPPEGSAGAGGPPMTGQDSYAAGPAAASPSAPATLDLSAASSAGPAPSSAASPTTSALGANAGGTPAPADPASAAATPTAAAAPVTTGDGPPASGEGLAAVTASAGPSPAAVAPAANGSTPSPSPSAPSPPSARAAVTPAAPGAGPGQ